MSYSDSDSICNMLSIFIT